jgi:quinol monooxygenase YgiN
MYGTVAKFRIKPGKEQALRELTDAHVDSIDGIAFEHVYRMDDDPQVLYIVVGFESKEAYRTNAESPEMHQRYLQYRELLEADPEWHDGEIIDSSLHDND